MCEECLVHHEAKGEYRQREDEDRGHCSDEWRLAFETTLAAALAPPCCTGSECACELTSAFSAFAVRARACIRGARAHAHMLSLVLDSV